MTIDHDAEAAGQAAQQLAADGDLEAAIEYLSAVQSELDHYGLWHNLGRLQMDAGREMDAIQSFGRALAKGYAPSRVERGRAYDILTMNKEAEADYLEALRDSPDDVEAAVNLGTLYLETGRISLAETQLERAAELDPAAHWQLADVYLTRGHWERALQAAETAIAAGELRAYLEKALALEGMQQDALPAFHAAVESGAATAESELSRYLAVQRPPEAS